MQLQEETYHDFPVDERSPEEVKKAKAAGYVEVKEYSTADLNKGYFCNTCEYFIRANTNTGYWCKKVKFADQPYGCCNYWERK